MKFAATVINGWKNYQTSAQTDGEILWNSVKFFCKSKSANDQLQLFMRAFHVMNALKYEEKAQEV